MMMNGIPIITTDGYGLSDMFKSGENASVVKLNGRKRPKNIAEDLANAIVSLLHSEELCEYLGKKAYEAYKNRYQLKHMRMGYVKLMNEFSTGMVVKSSGRQVQIFFPDDSATICGLAYCSSDGKSS